MEEEQEEINWDKWDEELRHIELEEELRKKQKQLEAARKKKAEDAIALSQGSGAEAPCAHRQKNRENARSEG